MKIEQITVFKVKRSDLEKAINEHFSINFDFVESEELMNDICKVYIIQPVDLDAYDKQKLAEGNYMYMTNRFLRKMCFDGKIEAGKYVIEVSW